LEARPYSFDFGDDPLAAELDRGYLIGTEEVRRTVDPSREAAVLFVGESTL
jgi:hypothetical protein